MPAASQEVWVQATMNQRYMGVAYTKLDKPFKMTEADAADAEALRMITRVSAPARYVAPPPPQPVQTRAMGTENDSADESGAPQEPPFAPQATQAAATVPADALAVAQAAKTGGTQPRYPNRAMNSRR